MRLLRPGGSLDEVQALTQRLGTNVVRGRLSWKAGWPRGCLCCEIRGAAALRHARRANARLRGNRTALRRGVRSAFAAGSRLSGPDSAHRSTALYEKVAWVRLAQTRSPVGHMTNVQTGM